MEEHSTPKKNIKRNMLDAAWALFLKNGYEETTVEQILEASHASRGSFYHHFRGKEDILFQLAYYFDSTYEEWVEKADDAVSAIDFLIAFDWYTMQTLEDSPYQALFADLYGLQVRTSGERHILNPQRIYYQLLARMMRQGVESGEIISSMSFKELAEMYIVIERGMTYNWLLDHKRFCLPQYSQRVIVPFLNALRNPNWAPPKAGV